MCSSGVPQCNQLTRMPLTTKVLCKHTIDNFGTCPAPWRHLSGNYNLFLREKIIYNIHC